MGGRISDVRAYFCHPVQILWLYTFVHIQLVCPLLSSPVMRTTTTFVLMKQVSRTPQAKSGGQLCKVFILFIMQGLFILDKP
nr:MAG TPA: hypothetical protein [Caudoviricetes sp.]